jgi:hypothetical protein
MNGAEDREIASLIVAVAPRFSLATKRQGNGESANVRRAISVEASVEPSSMTTSSICRYVCANTDSIARLTNRAWL